MCTLVTWKAHILLGSVFKPLLGGVMSILTYGNSSYVFPALCVNVFSIDHSCVRDLRLQGDGGHITKAKVWSCFQSIFLSVVAFRRGPHVFTRNWGTYIEQLAHTVVLGLTGVM